MDFPAGTRYEAVLSGREAYFDAASVDVKEHTVSSSLDELYAGYTLLHPDTMSHANVQAALVRGKKKLEFRAGIAVARGSEPDIKMILSAPQRSWNSAFPARKYLARTGLELGGGKPDDVDAPAHYQRMFDLGRYLFAASSFPKGLPPNLQGIWNERIKSPCDADYHLDINLQMNLWHVPAGNLLDFHEALFCLVDGIIEGARLNARHIFNMRGIAFPTTTCGHGEARKHCDVWPGVSGWVMQHYWTHWRYTLDRNFLKERFFPVLREVCRFYLDYLTEEEGRLIIRPSVSPENRMPVRRQFQYGVNSTFDLAVFREVFRYVVQAGEILGCSDDLLVKEAVHALARLSKYSLAADGRLREMEDYEWERGHRHLSHLYPLFPGNEITPETPELFHAAKLALFHFRKWPSTGSLKWIESPWWDSLVAWTYPQLACTYARLGDGNEAIGMLRRFSRGYRCWNGIGLHWNDWGYGHLSSPALLGKLIQLDATFGAVAAIQEMLLQSHCGIIRLLPALPRSWREGEFHGFRAEDGFEIDAEWKEHRLVFTHINSLLGQTCRLKLSRGHGYRITDKNLKTVDGTVDQQMRTVSFQTRRGAVYTVRPTSS